MQSGYEYTRETAADVWDNHPLSVGVGLFALGVAAGMLLPGTLPEHRAFGETAGNLVEKVTTGAKDLLDQGRKIAGKVAERSATAVANEADRVGLTPKKIARKVTKIASRVKQAVSGTTGTA